MPGVMVDMYTNSGAQSLADVLWILGKEVPPQELMDGLPHSAVWAAFRQIMDAANILEVTSETHLWNTEQLTEHFEGEGPPVIIHYTDGHFSACVSCEEESFVLQAAGKRDHVSKEALERVWDGYVLVFPPNPHSVLP